MDRKYLPTLGELIDRLSIVQLKEVKIPKHKEEYAKEISEIVHDINEILKEKPPVDGDFIRAVVVVSQMNSHIWYNEDNARNGEDVGNKLMLTHGLNGIRNTAKNKIQVREPVQSSTLCFTVILFLILQLNKVTR